MEADREREKEQHEKEILELRLKLPKDADGDKVSPAKARFPKFPPLMKLRIIKIHTSILRGLRDSLVLRNGHPVVGL